MIKSLRAHPWHMPVIFGITFMIHHLDRNVMAYSLPSIATEFNWSDQELGYWGQYLLGSFFVTYGLAQALLSGPAERFGAKRSLLGAILGFSLVSIGFGLVGKVLLALVGLRLVLGVAESVHVPMMSALIAQNFPETIRATANSVWGTGIKLAAALGPLMIVPLIAWLGWRAGFIVVGFTGMIVGASLVFFFVHSRTPSSPPSEATSARPTYAFIRDAGFWVYMVIGLMNNVAGFGILGWMPTYFVRAKHIEFAALAEPLSIIGFIGVFGMLLFAWAGDRLKLRLWVASAGLATSGMALLLVPFIDGVPGVIALFALANLGQSTFAAIEWSTAQLIAKDKDVGAATGIYNGIGVLVGGVLGSMVPGAIVAATGNFDLALLAIAAAAITGGVMIGGLARHRPELN